VLRASGSGNLCASAWSEMAIMRSSPPTETEGDLGIGLVLTGSLLPASRSVSNQPCQAPTAGQDAEALAPWLPLPLLVPGLFFEFLAVHLSGVGKVRAAKGGVGTEVGRQGRVTFSDTLVLI